MKISRNAMYSIVVLGSLVLPATGCGSDSTVQNSAPAASAPPTTVIDGHGREMETFSSLDEMTRSADLVVVASVVSVGKGRRVEPKGAPPVGLTESKWQIEQVISGGAKEGDVVSLEETSVYADQPATLNGSRIARDGERAILFLRLKQGELTTDGSQAFRLVSTQGRFSELADGKVQANYLDPDHIDEELPAETVKMIDDAATQTFTELVSSVSKLANN